MNKNHQKIRIGEAAKILGVNIQTLRNWEKSGKLQALRSPGGQRYYLLSDIDQFKIDIQSLGWAWSASAQAPMLAPEHYCERQDRFTSRLEKMSVALLHSLGNEKKDLVSLVTLVAGEIGDNSFAHNVGNWPDTPGVFYAFDVNKRIIVLADRGRGIKATLRNIRPNVASDTEALHIAFTEIISGRSPEKRGNGLKVVRRVAETADIGLLLRSGVGQVNIPKVPGLMKIVMADQNIRGVYAVITF